MHLERTPAAPAQPPSSEATDAVMPAEPAGPPRRPRGLRGSRPWAVVRALRPRQWLKNTLVLAAPLAAGQLFAARVIGPTAIALALFCLASSAVYLANDTIDVAEDRRHPTKRFRPIAAGLVPRPLAVVLSMVLVATALTVAALFTRPALAWLLGGYVAIQLAYCLGLKNQPVLDLAVVASGFLLRGVAGGVAAGLPLSQWFLLVAAFGSLFMVAGKRYSELVTVGETAATRKALQEYSPSYLRFVWGLSAGVAVTAYGLWAFDMGHRHGGTLWPTLSIAPFVLAILRYAVDIDRGAAGTPEEIVLHDRVLLALGLIWIVTVAPGVFNVF